MVPLQAYVSDSRLYSLHENLLKRLLKKKKQKQQKTEKTNIFFLQQVEQTLTLCTIIRHGTSILSLQKVIYILKQLIIRHGYCLQKYCN